MKKQTVPITRRALVQRINRALAKDGEAVRATRGARAYLDLGDYYRLDIQRNCVIEKNVDLEALGRELEVIAQWESIPKEEL